MCSKTTVAPLERIKILLQAHNEHYRKLGKVEYFNYYNLYFFKSSDN